MVIICFHRISLLDVFTKPIARDPLENILPKDVLEAQQKLKARRKLSSILRSKAITEIPLRIGDLVEVYSKKQHSKRGSWSAPKKILSVDNESRCITVPGKPGKVITAAFENVRTAIKDVELAELVKTSLDELDEDIKNGIDSSPVRMAAQDEEYVQGTEHSDPDDADFSSDSPVIPLVGYRIDIYWPLDSQYYSGTVDRQDRLDSNPSRKSAIEISYMMMVKPSALTC